MIAPPTAFRLFPIPLKICGPFSIKNLAIYPNPASAAPARSMNPSVNSLTRFLISVGIKAATFGAMFLKPSINDFTKLLKAVFSGENMIPPIDLKRLGIVFVKNSRIAGPNFTNAAIRSPIPAPIPNAKRLKPLVKIVVKAPLLKNVLITELKVSMNPPAIEAALPSRSAVSPTAAVASPLLNKALKPLPIREPILLKMFPSPLKTLPKIVACLAMPLKAGSPVLTIDTKSLKNEPNFVVPENNPKKLLLKSPRTPSVLLITVKNS